MDENIVLSVDDSSGKKNEISQVLLDSVNHSGNLNFN